MALTNNLVLAKGDHTALAEAMRERQPGDKVRIVLEATVVENLTESASFDVDSVETVSGGASADVESETPAESTLAASVLGVMAKRKGKK